MGIVDNTNNTAKEKWERRRTIKQHLKALGTCKIPSFYSCVTKSKFSSVETRVSLLGESFLQPETLQRDLVCLVVTSGVKSELSQDPSRRILFPGNSYIALLWFGNTGSRVRFGVLACWPKGLPGRSRWGKGTATKWWGVW